MKGDCTLRGFEHVGKAIFCGKVKRRKKEHEATGAEDEAENDDSDNEVDGSGRACRQKGWWKRGDVEAKLNTVNMTAWVHKECDIIEEEALTKLQGAWDSSDQKDECTVCLDDLEWAYDDPSFIVLTETKFSFRCIPVWDRYSPHRTRVEKKKHM
jgi:hypothetical protein